MSSAARIPHVLPFIPRTWLADAAMLTAPASRRRAIDAATAHIKELYPQFYSPEKQACKSR